MSEDESSQKLWENAYSSLKAEDFPTCLRDLEGLLLQGSDDIKVST